MERALRQWIKSEYLMVRLFPMPVDQHQDGVDLARMNGTILLYPSSYTRGHYTSNRTIAHMFKLDPFEHWLIHRFSRKNIIYEASHATYRLIPSFSTMSEGDHRRGWFTHLLKLKPVIDQLRANNLKNAFFAFLVGCNQIGKCLPDGDGAVRRKVHSFLFRP